MDGRYIDQMSQRRKQGSKHAKLLPKVEISYWIYNGNMKLNLLDTLKMTMKLIISSFIISQVP